MPVPKRENLTEVFAIDQTIGMVHSTAEETVPSQSVSSFLIQLKVSMDIRLLNSPDALAMAKIENLERMKRTTTTKVQKTENYPKFSL